MPDSLSDGRTMECRNRISRFVLGMQVHAISYDEVTRVVCESARHGVAGYVCVANVHMVMEAWDDSAFRTIVNSANLVTPDGMPLVWWLRQRGVADASRVYGPELTIRLCEAAAENGVPVGFYGGSPYANNRVVTAMRQRFPALDVAYAESPPFRPLSPDEDKAAVDRIRESGTRILFVALGCPKQERWMAAHRDDLPVIQLGVGAAFSLLAGEISQAPPWLQRIGLEWAFRLVMEPRRLWKRYLIGNTRFVFLLAREYLSR